MHSYLFYKFSVLFCQKRAQQGILFSQIWLLNDKHTHIHYTVYTGVQNLSLSSSWNIVIFVFIKIMNCTLKKSKILIKP